MIRSVRMEAEGEITVLLRRWREGDKQALDLLMPLVYPRLRSIAAGMGRQSSKTPTLQATGLVHEAYLRLLNRNSISINDREHFFSFAAQVMRHILVDHVRTRQSQKRGGARERIPFHEEMQWVSLDGEDILALNRALDELAAVDERKVRLIELRYFLGCTAEETSDLLQISKATVDRDLQVARAWLFRRLNGSVSESAPSA
jgi:RNA polymerase sigma factor (TIGR02999 family)